MRDVQALAKLREAREMTQQGVAEVLNVSQANVSRIERQEDLYLSTLSSYIAALGGRLEVRAVFPDESVVLLAPPAHGSGGERTEPVAESER
jgi:transcriptional regulator with XRE-family HTH domain